MRLNGILLHMLHCTSGSRCDLCLTEKLKIIQEDPELLLNKQSELVSKCRQIDFSKHQVAIPLPHMLQLEMTDVLNQLSFGLTYHVMLFRS